MEPVFFQTSAEFRKWLEKNHKTEREVLIGYYKTGSKKTGITYGQSVDEAICFGWIDGIRKSIDKESYCNRFTPRKSRSNWSEINIKKAEMLIKHGLMHPSGLEVYLKRIDTNSREFSYENKPEKLSEDLEQKLKENEKAWKFFTSGNPSYQKTVYYWIMSAKQEKTRISRLQKLIEASEAGKKL